MSKKIIWDRLTVIELDEKINEINQVRDQIKNIVQTVVEIMARCSPKRYKNTIITPSSAGGIGWNVTVLAERSYPSELLKVQVVVMCGDSAYRVTEPSCNIPRELLKEVRDSLPLLIQCGEQEFSGFSEDIRKILNF